jgi:hypothetical protein
MIPSPSPTPPTTSPTTPHTNQQVFETIYEKNVWGHRNDLNGGNGSGIGSAPRHTIYTRQVLHDLIRRYNVSSLLDAPCGSMVWMPLLLNELDPPIHYLGVDVVKSVIRQHRQTFQLQRPSMQFQVCDISICGLPLGYDMIFTRDALQHLSPDLVMQFIQNVQESDAKYLVAGSYYHLHGNRNIQVGDYFDINLLDPPYSLPLPLEIISEGVFPGVIEKWLLVWEVEQLRLDVIPTRQNTIPTRLHIGSEATLSVSELVSWTYQVWTNDQIGEMIYHSYPSLVATYSLNSSSEMARLPALHTFGGFFLDDHFILDVDKLNNYLDKHLQMGLQMGALFVTTTNNRVVPYFFGCRRGHPIMYDFFHEWKTSHVDRSMESILTLVLQRRRVIYKDVVFLDQKEALLFVRPRSLQHL